MSEEKLHEMISELQERLRQGKIGRREFVRYASLLGLSLGAAETLAACAPAPTPTATPPPPTPTSPPPQPTVVVAPAPSPVVMEKDWQLLVDYDKCSGCRICEFECAKRHFDVINPELARIKLYKIYPGVDIAMYCRNCWGAPCIEACPTTPKAISKDEETGAIKVDPATCIKCDLCAEACLAKVIRFHPTEGYPLVCDLCDLDPACVAACPEEALSVVPPVLAPDTWAVPLDELAKELLEKMGLSAYIEEEA